MLTTFCDVIKHTDSKHQVDVVYFDLSKTFDSVPHDLLILKLQSFGFYGNLLNWFSDYLSHRYQCVVINSEHSDWLTIDSGVPQGSIIGPLQFILYNNDLPSVISTGTSIGIYTDDTKIHRCISTIETV